MVKIVDVAREAGTSVATVSRALNNNDRVDPQLAARVRAAAEKLGYRPNHLARSLRRQRSNLWLLIISDIEVSFFTSVARGVEDIAVANGYSVVLCNADEDETKESQYIQLAAAEHAAGVIISPHSTQTQIDRLAADSIPVVVIDRSIAAPVDWVMVDSRGGALAATEHLIRQGWQRPACVTGPRSAETAMLRRLGYEDALRAAGIRTRRVAHRSFHLDGGRAGAASLLDRDRPPDSFFVANAALALGVLQELHARGLRPGRDVGLICFDDAPWAPFIDPPISVVAQPAYRIGTQAATLLVDRIGGTADAAPRRVVLGTDLILRESSVHP
ncbi:LacI family DNA-binding transcriptional regulator [Actinocatenispora comari]|uniref:LacI family transcriptional regulator n=1 Tax=Actinocatenispora comari TaxID=2807577 RepID=A0A8J4AA46_9ACTN|nr:LacI family DNA-binding transcriptional regulator [Actinocatenispora comari]GIL27000.1 LacI family transcriptional regulator [Actinocatenispora comari]